MNTNGWIRYQPTKHECVADGDNIALTLWDQPGDIGGGSGQVHHGDSCLLLDEATSDGISRVQLQCPAGTGWLRAEAISRN